MLNGKKHYIQVQPRAQKSSYAPDDSIDMVIRLDPGQELVQGTVRLHGTLQYTKTNGSTPLDYSTDAVHCNAHVGIHSFFDNFVTSFDGRVIESNFNDYGRFIKLYSECTTNSTETALNTASNIEWKMNNYLQSTAVLIGDSDSPPNMRFNFQPRICLNRTSRNVRQTDVNEILLSFRLNSQFRACFGSSNTSANSMTYVIQDLKASFISQPISKQDGPLVLKTTSMAQYTLNSQVSHVEIEIPIPTLTMTSCVVSTTNQGINYFATNYLTTERVVYRFNDTNGRLLTYELDNDEEILANAKRSMTVKGESEIDDLLLANKNIDDSTTGDDSHWLYGINYSGVMPPGTKVSVELNASEPDSNSTYVLFNYFNGVVQL